MPDNEEQPLSDEETPAEDESSTEEEGPDELATLKAEVALLRTQNTRALNEAKSAIGRYQALQAKVESGSAATEAEAKRLNGAVSAVNEALDALLDDESLSPEVKARVRQVRDSKQRASEVDALRAEIDALKNPPKREEEPRGQDELTPIERQVHRMINAAGLKIEDFDWDQAKVHYTLNGDDGVISYFTEQIVQKKTSSASKPKALDEKKANAGPGAPRGSATNVRPLDPSRPLEERLKYMREQGII